MFKQLTAGNTYSRILHLVAEKLQGKLVYPENIARLIESRLFLMFFNRVFIPLKNVLITGLGNENLSGKLSAFVANWNSFSFFIELKILEQGYFIKISKQK